MPQRKRFGVPRMLQFQIYCTFSVTFVESAPAVEVMVTLMVKLPAGVPFGFV